MVLARLKTVVLLTVRLRGSSVKASEAYIIQLKTALFFGEDKIKKGIAK